MEIGTLEVGEFWVRYVSTYTRPYSTVSYIHLADGYESCQKEWLLQRLVNSRENVSVSLRNGYITIKKITRNGTVVKISSGSGIRGTMNSRALRDVCGKR